MTSLTWIFAFWICLFVYFTFLWWFCGILWCFVVFCAFLWYFVVFCGILWYSVVFCAFYPFPTVIVQSWIWSNLIQLQHCGQTLYLGVQHGWTSQWCHFGSETISLHVLAGCLCLVLCDCSLVEIHLFSKEKSVQSRYANVIDSDHQGPRIDNTYSIPENTLQVSVFSAWLLFVLVNAYYGGTLTSYFATSPSLPFQSLREALLKYPSWKLIMISGYEGKVKVQATIARNPHKCLRPFC